jgi:hypothetical protein
VTHAIRTHDDLVAALERERISYPDELEAERYRPGGVVYVDGTPVRYTPISEEQAARNLARLELWPWRSEGDDGPAAETSRP